MKKKLAPSKSKPTSADSTAEEEAPSISFEQGLAQTQQIVRELESGELTLEESLKAYETGVRTIRQCQHLLSDFERRIELLTGFDKEGNPITAAFEESEMTLEEKQQSRGRRRGAGSKSKPADEDDDSVLF